MLGRMEGRYLNVLFEVYFTFPVSFENGFLASPYNQKTGLQVLLPKL